MKLRITIVLEYSSPLTESERARIEEKTTQAAGLIPGGMYADITIEEI